MATISNVTTATRTTSGSSLQFTSVTANPGDWLVVVVAADNAGTNGVAAMSTGGISDSASNTWNNRVLANRTAGTANDGATIAIWTGQLNYALSSGSITVTFSPNVTRAAGVVYKVVPAAGKYIVYRTVSTASTGSSYNIAHTTASITNGDTVFCGAAVETYSALGGDSDTTNGSWSTIYGVQSSSGIHSSSMSVGAQWKTVTATATQTWNPTWGTTARDYAVNSFSLYEANIPPLGSEDTRGYSPRPQDVASREVAGYGVVLAATAALFGAADPPLNAAEYHHGTHQAAIHDQGIRGSLVFNRYPHPGVAAKVNRPNTWTIPQHWDQVQSRVFQNLVKQTDLLERPRTWTIPQPFDVDQGRVDRVLIQQFIPPPNRPEIVTDPQTPEQVFPAVFKAWQYTTVQSPPPRPYIITSAETPWDVPSNLRGDISQYAPEQPPAAGAEYHYGTHQEQIFDSQNPSKVWYHKIYVPPQDPPNRPYIQTLPQVPLYYPPLVETKAPHIPPPPVVPDNLPSGWEFQHGTHQLHILQQGNRPTIFLGWGIRTIEFYFISHYTVGEVEVPLDNTPSLVFKQAPAEGPPLVEPDLIHPILTTQEGIYYRPPTVFHPWLDASATSRGKFLSTDPSRYDPRNDSQVWHHPPKTVEQVERYFAILTYPQWDHQVRPSSVFTRKDIPSTGARERYLTGMDIGFYQGTITTLRRCYVGRIVTEPKLLGATAELNPPFNFANWMDAGETIQTFTVTASVYSGVDSTPSAIKSGAAWVENRTEVHQKLRGGVLGCVYELLCQVTTSNGQILQQTTYYYIEPDLP